MGRAILHLPDVFDLFLQLPKNNCSEGFEKSILRLLNKAEEADSCEVEEILR